MPDSLSWELRFVNEFSSAAKAAGQDMRNFSQTIQETKAKLEGLSVTEQKEAKTAREAKAEHQSFFGDMFKADVLAERFNELIDKVAEYAAELASAAIEATDTDYKTEVALTHMAGSAEVAQDIMEHARAFANGVGEDIDKVYQVFQRLAATGLRGDQLTAAADAAKDLGIVSGRSFDQTAELFEMIGSDRGLGGRAVRQLSQFPGLLKELEKHFGVTAKGGEAALEELSKKLQDAPLKGAEGLALLESMITNVAHEDKLGDTAVESGEAFEGSFTKIRNDFKEILGGMSKDPLFVELREEIGHIADYFEPGAEGGKRLAATLRELELPISQIVGLINQNPGLIAGVFESAMLPVKLLAADLEGILFVIHEIQHAGAYLGALLETHSFKKAHDIVNDDEAAEQSRAANDARDARDASLSPAEKKEMADTLALPIPGPHTLPPLDPIPHAAAGTSVDTPTLLWAGDGGETEHVIPESKLGGSAGGGGSPSVTINVSVEGGHPVTEQDLAAKMQEIMPGLLVNAFEQMAEQKGGG